MRHPARTAFGAIFHTELRLNSQRVVPYAMALLCGGNALLWWGWGPAGSRGWATNSEHFIAGMLPVFSFMTLPLFTAVIMGDPVSRDFRMGVTPLIFSKPVRPATYLLGKFCGNFCTLVCCQMAFPLTLIVLQGFRRPHMLVQSVRVLPYFKHFFMLVVISHLVLAAFYFTVGTLTRNAKIVYGLAVSFYPLYIAYQVALLKGLPTRWRSLLDPLLMNWQQETTQGHSAEWLNQLAVSYDMDVLANRAIMMLIAAVCLTILYLRFAIAERSGETERHIQFLNLSPRDGRAYYSGDSLHQARADRAETIGAPAKIALPKVHTTIGGLRANLKQLRAATGVEFRLLRTERSLVVTLPLAMFFSTFELAFWAVVPDVSYSAAYAGRTANALLLFLLGIAIFYTGEAMHRDRDLRIEPILWSVPAPNHVLLLSKFLATLVLTCALIALVALTAIGLQFYKGNGPVELSAYLAVYTIILLPSIILLVGLSVALNVLLRDKYLGYVVSIATSGGLFYLYGQGYNHWLYNPLLYKLWNYPELTGAGSNHARLLLHRIYCLAFTLLCLALAHLFFQRKSTKRFIVNKRLSSAGWSALLAVFALAVTIITGLLIWPLH